MKNNVNYSKKLESNTKIKFEAKSILNFNFPFIIE